MKKQVNPVVTAIALLLALGAVLFVYTKGLLGKKEAPAGDMQGGGPAMVAPPPVGLASVTVETLAGWSAPGLVDGKGWDAKFNGPSGIAVARDGSAYVSDSRNHRIRHITPDGVVTTVAGSGPVDCLRGGFADGLAAEARFSNPTGLAVGFDGSVYIADTGNHRIRKLKDGIVTTLAGAATPIDALGFESGGYVDGLAGDALFKHPSDVEAIGADSLMIADLGNHAMRQVLRDTVRTETTGLVAPTSLLGSRTDTAALDLTFTIADPEAGALQQTAQGALTALTVSGHAPTRPAGVDRLPDGSLIVVDTYWHAIFAVAPSGKGTLLAGILPEAPMPGVKDGTGSAGRFATPCAVATDGWTAYVADFGNNCVRKITIPPDWELPPPPPPEPSPRWEGRGQSQRDGNDDRGPRSPGGR